MRAVVYADKQLLIEFVPPQGLRLSGELDAWNVESASASIAKNLPDGDIHFDLSDLSFCDIDGIRALVSLAENIKENQRMILHGLAPQLRNVLNIVGWAQMPHLVIEDSGADRR